MVEAVAVAFSMACPQEAVQDGEQARGVLAAFRGELFRCFGKYRDTLFEVCDAVLCKQDRVHMAAELSLEPECRRGHGAVCKALNRGQVQVARLRWALAALPMPAWDDGRIRLAVDVSNWLRPDAATSPGRLFCHCYARGKGNAQMIPGWPYSLVVALEPGRTSWVRPLDAVRLGPADDATGVTAGQVRQVVMQIIAAGHWKAGPDILVIFDAGYDLTRLAWLLRDLPVEVLGRLRSDRVMYFPARPHPAGAAGRPARHGQAFRLAGEKTWPAPPVSTRTETTRYGPVAAAAWGRLHQKLASRAGWEDHDGPLPVIEGTLIRLHAASHLPGYRPLEPMWLWSSRPDASPGEVTALWQAYLRRFDLEHTFRFFKQVLGWTRPRLRDPAAADRWTWLVIAAYTQLWLARHLAADLRLPWQRPCPPGRLTPARVRRGFRNIRHTMPGMASAPKPGKPGPGRPPGSKNRHPATRHDVGKTVKRAETLKDPRKQTGLNNKLRACLETKAATANVRPVS
jgi:DDE superfamily endonuclease